MLWKPIRVPAAVAFATSVLFACTAPAGDSGRGFIQDLIAPAPTPGTVFLYPEPVPLRDGGLAFVERGMIFMPVNRSDPESKVTGLEIYRFRASENANPDTPPIFFLHGGPSFLGLEEQLSEPGAFEERWSPFTDVSDVVVVSQRGIGPSKPTTWIDLTTLPPPLDQDIDENSEVAEFKRLLARERDAWLSQGLDLAGFTILEAAADVDDVRRAFGYEKITLWGGSFGSHWGMAVMRYYPETVERAILRGMEGPDHTYDHPGHIWNVYERVAEEAESAPEFSGLIPEGGLIQAAVTILDRLAADPFSVTVFDPETREAVDVLLSRNSPAGEGLARGYSGTLTAWPADIITMYRGDFSRAAEAAVRNRDVDRRSYRTASYFMLDCGSGITPGRLAEYRADPAVELVGMLNQGYLTGCSEWDSDLGDDFRQNFETDIPTVIVHGTWDTSTPYENALELVPFFTNSKFIPVIRGPHGSINAARQASEVFDREIFRFAATGDWSGLPDQVEMPEPEWALPER